MNLWALLQELRAIHQTLKEAMRTHASTAEARAAISAPATAVESPPGATLEVQEHTDGVAVFVCAAGRRERLSPQATQDVLKALHDPALLP